MYYFTIILTKAHIYKVVLSEAEKYKFAFENFKQKYPEWEFGSFKLRGNQ